MKVREEVGGGASGGQNRRCMFYPQSIENKSLISDSFLKFT